MHLTYYFALEAIFSVDCSSCLACACFYEQVDSVEKIEKLLKGKATDLDAEDFTRWQGADYNCLLIEVLTIFILLTCRHYACRNKKTQIILQLFLSITSSKINGL